LSDRSRSDRQASHAVVLLLTCLLASLLTGESVAEPPVVLLRRFTPLEVAGSPDRHDAPDAASKTGADTLKQEWLVEAAGQGAPQHPSVSRLPRRGTVILLDASPDQTLRLLTRQQFHLKPFHTYRLSMLLAAPPGATASFGAAFHNETGAGREPQYRHVWPQVHGAYGASPTGYVESGFLVNGPQERLVRLFVRRGPLPGERDDHRFSCFLRQGGLEDCGALPPAELAVRRRDEFDRAAGSLAAKGYVIAFARPDQLQQTEMNGGGVLHNRSGRALLFGPLLHARFGSVYRVRLRARGTGTVTLSAAPYMAPTGRFNVAQERRFRLQMGEWSQPTLTFGQYVPQANRVRVLVDLRGEVVVDWWETGGPLRRAD